MKIYQITNKKEYLSLLLLADEQESMIDKYIDNSTMYVLEDSGIKGEIVVCELQEKVLEIKGKDKSKQVSNKKVARENKIKTKKAVPIKK